MRLYNLSVNGNEYEVIIREVTEENIRAEVNGVEHIVAVNKITNLAAPEVAEEPIRLSTTAGSVTKISQVPSAVAGQTEGCVCSPIPGHVLEIAVEVGDKVLVGQKLLVLEAMKLENIITAEWGGMVKKILVAEGDTVNHDQKLIIIA